MTPAVRGMLRIGIDVGGTFTDVAVLDAGTGACVAAFKLPSTPADPSGAVRVALEQVAERHGVAGAMVCHGTTVGTNTLIERKGGPVALVATKGFRDVIELRRQARPELYAFDQRVSEPLVPPERRFEVAGRLAHDGAEVAPLAGLDVLCEAVRRANVASVAVCLLNAYASPVHERLVADALRSALPDVFVSVSSELAPEAREYERTSTAVVNAYIGSKVAAYLDRVHADVTGRGAAGLAIVKSSGGLTSPANAARQPVHLVESGPAAALVASARFGTACGVDRVLAFDMGGTTAKAGVAIDGVPRVATEFHADALVDGRNTGGYSILSTVLDLVEIGAGGGSIAWLDEAGILKVGPRSAGARPGPACYGFGGTQPTVTDAHAVIGTLLPGALAASGIGLDPRAAARVIDDVVARPRGWTTAVAAHAIIQVAVAQMAEMVRLATLRRGLDPRDFVMVPSGGAGPLHAVEIARQVGVRRVLVSPMPGVFSALGAAIAPMRHDAGRSLLRTVPELSPGELADAFAGLSSRLDALLEDEAASSEVRRDRAVDMRFRGQLFELRIPVDPSRSPEPKALGTAFRSAYAAEYGFDLPDAVPEIVSVRMSVEGRQGAPALTAFSAPAHTEPAAPAPAWLAVLGADGRHAPAQLMLVRPGQPATGTPGPAVIATLGATIWLPAGCHAAISSDGVVDISVGEPE